MKPLVLLLSLAALFMLPQCASKLPPVPGSDAYSGEEEAAYHRAYYFGYQDGHLNAEENYERYHSDYVPETEVAFARGYAQGYIGGLEHADATVEAEDAAHNTGYETGRADAQNGNSPFYQRHQSNFTEATEQDFRKGYVEGYNEVRKGLGSEAKLKKEP